MKIRRRARSLALQALYEIDSSDHAPELVISNRLAEEPLPTEGEAFMRTVVFGVLQYRDAMDHLIARYASEWPLAEMALVDRNILRIALYEFAVAQVTPLKVAINEAVEIARLFGADSTPRFINGVLGSLANQHHVLHEMIMRAMPPADASAPPPPFEAPPAPPVSD